MSSVFDTNRIAWTQGGFRLARWKRVRAMSVLVAVIGVQCMFISHARGISAPATLGLGLSQGLGPTSPADPLQYSRDFTIPGTSPGLTAFAALSVAPTSFPWGTVSGSSFEFSPAGVSAVQPEPGKLKKTVEPQAPGPGPSR